MTDGRIDIEDYDGGSRFVLTAGDERVEVVEGTALPPGADPGDPDPPDVLVHDAVRQTDERAGERMNARGDEAGVAAIATATTGDGLFGELLSLSMEGTAELNAGWRPLGDVAVDGESTGVVGIGGDVADGPVVVLRAGEETVVHAAPRALDGLAEAVDTVGIDPDAADLHVRGTDIERVPDDGESGVEQSGETAGAIERGDEPSNSGARDGEDKQCGGGPDHR